MLRRCALAGAAVCLATITAPTAADEPILVGDKLVYPEGAAIPRSLTETERIYIQRHPLTELRDATDPPTGPVHCVAEYEPMGAILIAWESFTSTLTQMAANITTIGDADVYVVVDNASERISAQNTLTSGGVDMGRVQFIIRTTDTVWIRDYGPRYIYEGDCRAIVDHTYNRSREDDDALNVYFGAQLGHEVYEIPLVHGGGNYHLNALDEGNATRLIANENSDLSDQEIIDLWLAYQNVNTTLWTPFPQSVDWTQHIDMWMQITGDSTIIISDWPYDSGSTQDNICDNAAADFAAAGFTVYRPPARLLWDTHYTYTNMVICNDLVLLPYYTNSQVTQHNSQALAVVQAAMPGKTVVQVNCETIIGYAGAMHCIVMHIPEPVGGANPTAYLRSPRGGESLNPGEQVEIRWISDDDQGVTDVDLLLSTDSGVTFPTIIAEATADDGSFLWTVPDIYTTHGRVRIVVHDTDTNTGHDQSDADITINGEPDCPGDLDGDLDVDQADLGILLGAYGNTAAGDIDGDGDTDQADLGVLLSNYGTTCD
ncbi:MAG: agmatine deiminase family protein [Phycisphaerales bacterium]|nr:agmatine deiminase family protein [Phycisphaerales bacterium]